MTVNESFTRNRFLIGSPTMTIDTGTNTVTFDVGASRSLDIKLGDSSGADLFSLKDGASTTIFAVNSDGDTDIYSFIDIAGISAPSVSAASEGRLYFDSTSNTLKLSENTGSFVDIITSESAFSGDLAGTSNEKLFHSTNTTTIEASSGNNINCLLGGNTASDYFVIKNASGTELMKLTGEAIDLNGTYLTDASGNIAITKGTPAAAAPGSGSQVAPVRRPPWS